MYKKRREIFAKQLEKNSVAVLFSGALKKMSADSNYDFVVNTNFYYLTGINQENVILLIIKGAYKIDYFLFMDEADEMMVKWVGRGLSVSEASLKSEIDFGCIKGYKQFEDVLTSTFISSRRNIYGVIDKVYLDLEKHSFDGEDGLSENLAKKIKDNFVGIKIMNCYQIIADMRVYKDQHEIDSIKRAVSITKLGLDAIMKTRNALYEYNYVAEYKYVLNSHNTTTSFPTIAASGANATTLHYVTNSNEVKMGNLILFDLGVKYDMYCSDITRTYPVSGKFSKRQKEIYEIVLAANKKTIKWLKPGVSFQEFLAFGKQVLIDGCKKIGLIKEDAEINKYYYHGLGHYLGLDVHDVGQYNEPFKEGIVITVEPGLYIAEEGIGIRIEDDVLITKDGCINLSKDIIKEIDEIEQFMK